MELGRDEGIGKGELVFFFFLIPFLFFFFFWVEVSMRDDSSHEIHQV